MPEPFDYEVVEEIAVLSTSNKGWNKKLCLISWNHRDPKYDIREWSPDGSKMGKGVTLSRDEIKGHVRAVVFPFGRFRLMED